MASSNSIWDVYHHNPGVRMFTLYHLSVTYIVFHYFFLHGLYSAHNLDLAGNRDMCLIPINFVFLSHFLSKMKNSRMKKCITVMAGLVCQCFEFIWGTYTRQQIEINLKCVYLRFLLFFYCLKWNNIFLFFSNIYNYYYYYFSICVFVFMK